MKSSDTLLILDLGSSSVRALLFDGNAQLITGGMARREHRFVTSAPGESSADADALRLLAEACIAEVLQHPAARDLRAMGMATFVGNVLGVGEDGTPVTPVYTYADTRCAEDASRLRAEWDASAIHTRTGCPLHSAYLPARLTWLRRTQPALEARCARFADLGTYCLQRWSGERDAPCSPSVASWSGLLARATADWDASLIAALGLGDRLPRIATTPLMLDMLAQQHPALRGVPCYPALGDGAAANLGAGAYEPGIAALTIGTTAALRVIDPAPLPFVPPGLWGYRLDETHHLIGGATSEGGSIHDWLRATLHLPDVDALEAALMDAVPDAHGLTILPLLAGERSPGYALDATGIISGLRLATTPVEIAQAALESVALRLALIAERLGEMRQIMVSGGALERSRAWAQMMADALDRPLTMLAEHELTARGAALWLRARSGGRRWEDSPPSVREVIAPRPHGAQALRAARARQTALYERAGFAH